MDFPNPPNAANEQSSLPTDRRGVIGTLGFAALGLLASTAASKAATPRIIIPSAATKASAPAFRPATAGFGELPPEWVRLQGSLLPEYTRYLGALKLQRIQPMQVISAHAKSKGAVWNKLPPKTWWNRMGYTLRVVDRIAVAMNSPVDEIVSAYRCPIYNAHCEGAKAGSWHQANIAVDVKFAARPAMVTAAARNLRDRGLFKGGVGGYGGFTHIDTRGTNINW